jgi:integrase
VVRLLVDQHTRQTKRHSLGTADVRAAQLALAAFVTKHGEIRNAEPAGMTVAQLLERHHERHVKPAAKADFARHSRRLLEHFGDAVIGDLTPAAVDGFTAAMKATGRGGSYTDRILDSLRSALSRAYKLGELASVPFIATVPRDRFERRLPSKEELAAMWAAADEPHLRMFYAILLNTGARPNAILSLTRFQIDLERRLINLQAPGRDETKKRNPVLPITDALLPCLRAATGDHLVSWHGKPLACIKTAWRRARARAGLPKDFQPYSVRHTLATELRARSVPEWECAGWLGHSTPYRTTEIYARFRPDYLSQARAAIDAWVKEIGALRQQSPGHVETPVRARNVLGPKAGSLQTLDTWSEWRDSNTRPQRPERCALPG